MAAILFQPFEIRTGYFITSQDCFGMNKIFFMALFFIKGSRLVDHSKSGQIGPYFQWSDI
jgi:hypothetical protein